jgi:hypothetical protein
VPGKNLVTADALSRAQIQTAPTEEEKQMETDVRLYINNIVEHLPATEGRLV